MVVAAAGDVDDSVFMVDEVFKINTQQEEDHHCHDGGNGGGCEVRGDIS